jgi:hypothetical protein
MGVVLRLLTIAFFILWCALSVAQGTIYESQGEAGPVFSDQPSPDAKPIDPPPPNVIEVTPSAPQDSAAATAAPTYTSLVISSPAQDSTVYTNTGAFNVRAQVEPDLRSAAGDEIQVRLDGNTLASSYGSTNLHISEANWEGAASSDDVEHTLQLAIVDETGAVLIESDPVTFYAHRATASRGVIHH